MDDYNKQKLEPSLGVSTSPAEPDKEKMDSSKVKNTRKGKRKNKDEPRSQPPNPFGQFLQHKRVMDGKVNFEKACVEWKEMSSENKRFYRHCFEEEKAAMGDGYRATKSKKEKQDSKSEKKATKNSRIGRGSKVNQQKEESVSSHQLLSKVQSVDSEINQLHSEARKLQETLCSEKIQLSLNQYKLEEKIVECSNVKEKYKVLLTQHSSCLVAGPDKK